MSVLAARRTRRLPAGVVLAVIVCLAALGNLASTAHAQMTVNVLMRVLMVRAGNAIGTGFTIEVDGRQYLITAKHVVASLKSEDTIQIRKDEDWSPIHVKVLRCEGPIDIAVLVPPRQLTVSLPMDVTTVDLLLGQDAFFAGYPYGNSYARVNSTHEPMSGTFPIAFLKKAIVSSLSQDETGPMVIYLDGHNNFGFSGGPIVFRDIRSGDTSYRLAGVVSGFTPELTPVLNPVKVNPGEDLSNEEAWRITCQHGQKVILRNTDQLVETNSGIVIGYAIQPAINLIREHPDGPKIAN